jgi:MFS family permease
MLLSRLRPSVYLPAIMFVWGAVAVGLAGCRSYEALAGVRAVLGIAESGFSPGVIFLLSSCEF